MENGAKNKKKLHPALIAVIVLASIIVVAAAAVAILGTNLLNRINRTDPSEALVSDQTPALTDEAPDMTPTPTRSPAPASTQAQTETPATPRPTLPISEFYEQTYLTDEQLAKMEADSVDENVINVLLIGGDRRAHSGGYNSDTMMIATVDKNNGRLKLTSLMRDQLVMIPGIGYGKLNSAAARGGVQLLFDTIYENFHVKIDKYVMVDLYTFVEIIDKMGGVTLKLTAEEISAANDCIAGLNKQLGVDYLWDGFIFADPGPVQLTGKQALGYVRIRKIDSEFVRVERQYALLGTVFAKFMKMGATKQYDMLYDLLPYVETNLTNAQIVSIATAALSLNQKGILFCRLPVEGLYQNGKWEKHFVFFCDLPAQSLKLNEFIYDNADEPKAIKLSEPNPSLPPRTPNPAGVTESPDAEGTNSGSLLGG